ncbi:peroxisomal bifunctional enzyme isoform X3 [Lingula anatina]|uniref:Peroxisomal bifunctional enzyme n=1 Tax=Lingula anatina TaxID=7574 RepID=A0A1S3ILT1_LINAN|nr:peroxisomal bifunctional enzyme isoform X3 [Lingula anatina]|eukprot:XP_013398851.1 peroxisomal bifunctional enzyme isoform X3 [Lingula anatina]
MADYRKQGDVAVLHANNPPVNALSYHVRQGLYDGIEAAEKDPSVKCIVICGKGKTFPVGADIREFASGSAKKFPNLIEVCDKIEACTKPVVAAIHGFALGGGLEISLGCHYRIGGTSCKVGFPEVNIGVLPGAGGTQRLPRVIGLKPSLDIITSGCHVGAKEALKLGILDKIVQGDVVTEGIKFAKSVQNQPLHGRRVSTMAVPDVSQANALCNSAMAEVKRKSSGLLAPVACVKSLRVAAQTPYKDGIKIESALMLQLMTSGQAKALQYAFFAERLASKWQVPGGASHATVTPRPVKSCAVVGGGYMGSGIVMCILNAGLPCILVEANQKFLDRGVKMIQGLYAGSVKLGKMSEQDAKKTLSLLKPSLRYEDLKDVDVVIEAVFEDMKLKQEVFGKLDKVCKKEALLCSNTSTLNIDKIASATRRPDRVMGMHFFAPAYYMKLLENIRGAETSPQTVATVTQLSVKIGKVPVLVGNCHGFVGNRMMAPYTTEAQRLLEEGAYPHQVDQVIEEFGIPMGPLKLGDLTGIDVGWKIRREVLKNLGIDRKNKEEMKARGLYSPIRDKVYEMGRYGRKTGAGFYKYEKAGSKVAIPDPLVMDIIDHHCREEGIDRRRIPPQEIYERCLYSLINEGFKTLEEGIAARPEDVDIIWLLGYGWPRYTGGPMHFASQLGLRRLYGRIEYYHNKYPDRDHWSPSRLLKTLSQQEHPVPLAQWGQFASTASRL